MLLCISGNRRLSAKVLSSSPNLKNELEYEEEEDEEDDELDEDLDDEDIDDESDLENEDSNLVLDQSLDISNKTTTMYNEGLNGKSSLNGSQIVADGSEKAENKPTKKHEVDRLAMGTTASKSRAPGTSLCQHTARIDLRRVRSCRDLSRRQLIYSPSDFLFKEKLGEGFFANVKKIISKENSQEMVISRMKLDPLLTTLFDKSGMKFATPTSSFFWKIKESLLSKKVQR